MPTASMLLKSFFRFSGFLFKIHTAFSRIMEKFISADSSRNTAHLF